jgi:hypothetical protein
VIDLTPNAIPSIHQENGSSLDGHLLLSLSANFKLLMK